MRSPESPENVDRKRWKCEKRVKELGVLLFQSLVLEDCTCTRGGVSPGLSLVYASRRDYGKLFCSNTVSMVLDA